MKLNFKKLKFSRISRFDNMVAVSLHQRVTSRSEMDTIGIYVAILILAAHNFLCDAIVVTQMG